MQLEAITTMNYVNYSDICNDMKKVIPVRFLNDIIMNIKIIDIFVVV